MNLLSRRQMRQAAAAGGAALTVLGSARSTAAGGRVNKNANLIGKRAIMRKVIFLLSLAFMLATPVSQAHHSSAMFNMKTRISLSGTVRKFQWTNPHSYIQLLVKDKNGVETEWSLELGAPNYLYNQGWRPSTVKAGQSINVTMAPLRNGTKGGLAIEVTTADGRKLGGSKL